jgi:hypothetical protein
MKRTPMNPGKGFKRPDAAELRKKQAEARLKVPVFRPRACKACGDRFTPARKGQAACGIECALQVVAEAKVKKERIATRAAKAAARPRSWWLTKAQEDFNAYIRARDADRPCISCLRHHDGSYDAGHYLTTGARPELRFTETNVHKQCVPCNRHLHGNPVLYRAELVRRVGLPEVERLEGPHAALKLTIPDLQALRDTYRAKLKELAR